MSVASHGFDRATVPLPGEIRQFDFPQVRSFDLDTGLSVRVARMPGLPVVSASLILEAGETGVPADRAGLAVLTGDALQAGTARRSGAELAEALERVGVGLAAATGWDATTVSLGCLSERLVDAVELMAEVVGEASFEKEEFTRIRQQRLATIRQRLMDPRRLADDAAAHFIFADGVAYSRSAGGTRASIGGVGREQAADTGPRARGWWWRGTSIPTRSRDWRDPCWHTVVARASLAPRWWWNPGRESAPCTCSTDPGPSSRRSESATWAWLAARTTSSP